MSSELDHSWVDAHSTEVEEVAGLLDESFEVKDISYGPEDVFESSETFGEEAGLMAVAESVKEVVKYLSEVNIGSVEFEGPSQYPGTSYELELVASSEGAYWQFNTEAKTDLPAHNNYLRQVETELKDNGYEVETVTEEYKPKSGFPDFQTKAVAD